MQIQEAVAQVIPWKAPHSKRGKKDVGLIPGFSRKWNTVFPPPPSPLKINGNYLAKDKHTKQYFDSSSIWPKEKRIPWQGTLTKLHISQLYLETRMFIPRLKKTVWVIGILRRTVVSDWRFDNLCGGYLQSQVVVLVSWKFNNPGEPFDWSVDRVAVGKCVMGDVFESRWSPDTFQAPYFQLLKLENLVRWSLLTFIYNRSTIWISYIFHTNKKSWIELSNDPIFNDVFHL